MHSYLSFWPKRNILQFLAVILNFCVKHKTHLSLKISEIEGFQSYFWLRRLTSSDFPQEIQVISTKYLIQRDLEE